MQMSPAIVGPPIFLPVFLKAVSAGFPSPADDFMDQPIDLSRELIQNTAATFIMKVKGNSAIDAGIFDGSLITVDRSLMPKDGDPVVVDVNGERSVKIARLVGGRMKLAYGNARYPEFGPGEDAEIDVFGVVTNAVRRFRR
jgi:DNA polymerase V